MDLSRINYPELGEGTNCYSLFSHPDLILERWGDYLVVNAYSEEIYSDDEKLLSIFETVKKQLPLRSALVRNFVPDRSSKSFDPEKHFKVVGEQSYPKEFIVKENGFSFVARPGQGFSMGLFLDQRNNRKELAELQLPIAKALNLFCYTGGFSVYLAKRGIQTENIDVSKVALDWAEENFQKNEIDVAEHRFLKVDALQWLKKDNQYGLVILDPPSFSRSKNGVFQIEKHLPVIIEKGFSRVAPGGYLFFSTNYEGWKKGTPSQQIKGLLKEKKASIIKTSEAPIDCILIRKGN